LNLSPVFGGDDINRKKKKNRKRILYQEKRVIYGGYLQGMGILKPSEKDVTTKPGMGTKRIRGGRREKSVLFEFDRGSL